MSEDRFSKQSTIYSQFRPLYPQELFSFILQNVIDKKLCWDCATGNGQAALALSPYFEKVIATDISAEQIKNAFKKPNIDYQIISAENMKLEPNTLDLITVAQALHWLNLDVFYERALRFLKPNGIIAVWGYDFFSISPELDSILDPYGRQFLKDYWSSKNQILMDGYKSIPFPFSKINTPDFNFSVDWNFHQMKGFLDSWSATQKFKDINQQDPFDSIKDSILKLWPNLNQTKRINWKLYLLVGRKPSNGKQDFQT